MAAKDKILAGDFTGGVISFDKKNGLHIKQNNILKKVEIVPINKETVLKYEIAQAPIDQKNGVYTVDISFVNGQKCLCALGSETYQKLLTSMYDSPSFDVQTKGKKKRGGVIATVAILVLAMFACVGTLGDSDSAASEVPPAVSSSTVEDSVDEAENTETVEKKPVVEEEKEVKKYKASTYKIGSDMPAGMYVLHCDGWVGGYFEICSDSSGEFESIIANDNFNTNSIVELKDGQYFKMTGCYAVASSDSWDLDTTDEGMFLVGFHIPAGEYKLEVKDNITETGYVEVCSSATHDFDSIISNDLFEGSTYITVENEQFLKITNCTIVSSPDVSYEIDSTIDERTFVEYLVHDDVSAYVEERADTVIKRLLDQGVIESEMTNDPAKLYDFMMSDYDAYYAGEGSVNSDYWKAVDLMYDLYKAGKAWVMGSENITTLPKLLAQDRTTLGVFN